MLNPKQEQFCQHYVANANATLSYKKVYDVAYNTAAAEGSRLLKDKEVRERIDQLIDEVNAEFNKDKLNTIKTLHEDIAVCQELGLYSEVRKYRDMIVKLQGHYEPTKLQVEQNIEFSFVVPGSVPKQEDKTDPEPSPEQPGEEAE